MFYRGRAAEVLSPRAEKRVWTEFTTCPCEDLREPGRVHVDPYGDVHVCQGIRRGQRLPRAAGNDLRRVFSPIRIRSSAPCCAAGPLRSSASMS